MFKIIGNSKIWLILSGILIALSVVSLFAFGLRIGIDYTGGTVISIKSDNPDRLNLTTETLREVGHNSVQVKEGEGESVIIKLGSLTPDEHNSILSKLQEKLGNAAESGYDTVGPTIGKDLAKRSIIAVILASIGIILYIAYAFRKLPKPLSSWSFGVSAVVALAHDLLTTIGLFALLGYFFYWVEVDVLFITALLTIMGFSVHDTIVVYDRLRENFIRHPHQPIALTAEQSINQTLVRSVNTSLTVILVLLALLLLGSESIRHFVLTLILGVTVGTYSSIFVASPLLVWWHRPVGERASK